MESNLTIRDFNKIASFIQRVVTEDDGEVYIRPFSEEPYPSETMASVELPMDEYYELMEMEETKALELLSIAIEKISTAWITIDKQYSDGDRFKIEGTCLGGMARWIEPLTGDTKIQIDYMKGWEAHIWDPLEAMMLEDDLPGAILPI